MNARIYLSVIAISFASHSVYAQHSEQPDSLTHELHELVVTARQPATRLVGSTLVSTIPGSNLADLGNALDVLAQLPMIKVEDGAVAVTGKSNVEIYIDGRPMRDGLELQQILSSNLKRVELLMAPGAEYASTTDAVLRITTRRNFVQGLSFTDQLSVRRRRRWSAMNDLALSYRAGGWEFFANGTINRDNPLAKGTTTNTLMYDGRETVVGSSQRNAYPTTAGVVKAGFNYTDGAAQSLGAYYRYNPERGDFSNTGTEWLDSEPAITRVIDKTIRAGSHLASVYYENTFAGKYTLHFDGDFRCASSDDASATQYPSTAGHAAVRSTSRRRSTLWAGKLYTSFPLAGGEFNAGTQDSYTCSRLDFRMLNDAVAGYTPSTRTDVRQTSAALFASWSRAFGQLTLRAGARYEYADYDFRVDGVRDTDTSRRDHLLTPDIALGYSFNDDASLNLSYRMATVKPPYAQLTGALTYTGLHEIEGGNPALRDERMHDLQLMGMWRGFMLQCDFTRATDTYAFVKQLYPAPDLQLLMHPVNIDVSALSVYLMWSSPVGCWTPEATVGLYRQWLELDGVRHNKPIFTYYFDNTVALPHGWSITANISGQSSGDMHTNRFGATPFTMDASLGKTFLNKALTIRLAATDIFGTACNDWTMLTGGIYVDKRQSYDRRGVALNVIYRFRPRRSAYKGTPASEAELRRL